LTKPWLTSGEVLRVAKTRQGISPYPQRATLEDFEPSSEDKAGAAANDGHVLISVWDTARTTMDQVLAIRGRAGQELPAFVLSVEEVVEIRAPGRDALYVVRDPLPEPERSLPGADGHCGIGDLARKPGEPRALVREICSRLVDISRARG
jgi:hypothetical protein